MHQSCINTNAVFNLIYFVYFKKKLFDSLFLVTFFIQDFSYSVVNWASYILYLQYILSKSNQPRNKSRKLLKIRGCHRFLCVLLNCHTHKWKYRNKLGGQRKSDNNVGKCHWIQKLVVDKWNTLSVARTRFVYTNRVDYLNYKTGILKDRI